MAVVAVIAACGQAGAADPGVATLHSPGTDPAASPSASVDPQQAFVDYARCMREHGIDMPDPNVDTSSGKVQLRVGTSGNVDEAKMAAAQSACQHFIANSRLGGGGKQVSPEDQDKFLAFARCMREHGIDMPDPDFSNGGVSMQIGQPGQKSNQGPGSQTFEDAQQACASLLPGTGPKTTTGSGGDGDSPSTQNGGSTDSGPGLEVQQ
jgi:hypothetical protein